MNNENYKIADAVFEGGGIKAIAFVGALKAMEEKGYVWRYLAGTSGGAVVASLIAVGYTSSEILSIVKNMDFTKMNDRKFISIPFISDMYNLIFNKGIYEGVYLKNFIDTLLSTKLKRSKKSPVTFRDLMDPLEDGVLLDNYKYKKKYKLHIIASDITNGKLMILPEDIKDYGIEPEDFHVSEAVRMSCSIPFFYKPVYLKDTKTHTTSIIVDGGLLSNYPVWLFDVKDKPKYPTIGFKLSGSKTVQGDENITNLISYGKKIIKTMLESQNNMHIKEMDYLRTIKIDPKNYHTTDFIIKEKDILNLYESGEYSANSFLENWEDNYKAHLTLRKNHNHIENIII
ncbi:patatin-like phospholipase family protein [Clostridium polynesiense]|uniref:patatin-like phospholipase family protein n=1 Tax=Clostridium polynesiense TaxID=1325933 RepID=UPI00058E77EE|nr:patatin-like phospholipase family protein [Clostridium polynesiense]